MKKLYFSFVMAIMAALANGQGTNCSNAINLIPTNNLTYSANTSGGKEMWFKFTAGAPNVNIALKTKQFGINQEHTHEATLYSGSCGNLTEIKKDELPFVDYAEELSIDMNASGLIPGNNYFLKIDREAHLLPCDKSNCTANNSSNPALFDLAVQDINILVPLDFGLEKPPSAYSYEQNRGQLIDVNGNYVPDIKMYNSRMNPAIYLGDDKASFVWSKIDTIGSTQDTLHRVDMTLVGSNPKPQIFRTENISSQTNYFLAHTKKGVHNKESYGRIVAKEVYNKIDMQLSANNLGIKIYFTVQPGGNADNIVMKFDGATAVNVTANKGLEVITPLGILDFEAGHAYQINPGNQIIPMPWQAEFISLGGNKVKLDIRQYPQNMPLFIQIDRGHKTTPAPTANGNLDWSTYFGGTSFDIFNDVTTDNAGNVFVSGGTYSVNFPDTNAYQGNNAGSEDAVVIKFDQNGKLIWSTYLGGTGDEEAKAVEVNNNIGSIYITGFTRSNNFPLNSEGGLPFFDSLNNCLGPCSPQDIFITKFNPGGIIQWSTYFGGPDNGNGVDIPKDMAIDNKGNIYLVGKTNNQAPLYDPNILNPGIGSYWDDQAGGIIVKFNSLGRLRWSTKFGSTTPAPININGVETDSQDNVIITGVSGDSPDFPIIDSIGNAYIDSVAEGIYDAFIAKFDSLNRLRWSTYFGGNDIDIGNGISVDNNDNIFLTGETISDSIFPLKNPGSPAFFNQIYRGAGTQGAFLGDAFISKFSSQGEELSCFYLGGSANDQLLKSVSNNNGDVFFIGNTYSSDLSTSSTNLQNAFMQDNHADGTDREIDGFLFSLNDNQSLKWLTYFGGTVDTVIDPRPDYIISSSIFQNKLYIVGITFSAQYPAGPFPLVDLGNGAYFQDNWGVSFTTYDAFISRFDLFFAPVTSEIRELPDNKFTVFPNPFNNNISINVNSSKKNTVLVSFLDVTGRILQNGEYELTEGANQININYSFLTPGIYFLNIIDNNSTILSTKKLIKY